jgi:dodecin
MAQLKEANARAPRSDDHEETAVYRIVDVIGVSQVSWEDAAARAVETAAKSLRDLRIAEVTKMDLKIEDGKIVAFRTKVALSFRYDAE